MTASAAVRARLRWHNGSQRKLQRNTPKLGNRHSANAAPVSARSHPSRRTSHPRPVHTPAASSASGTKPPASSSAGRGCRFPPKSAHGVVPHAGLTNPANARHGTTQAEATT